MIYSLTAISFFLVSIYLWREQSWEKTRLALFLSVIWLILYEGLRWDIGTDWIHYYNCFVDNDNEHMGFMYRFINSCFRVFTDSYTVFLLFYAGFTYFVIGKWLHQYSPNPLISICIYFCSMIGLLGSNRQMLAMVFCIISLRFIVERKKWWFIGVIMFATTIHITAFSFIIAYFLYNYSYSNKKALIITGVAFLVGVLHLVNKIPLVEYLAILDSMTTNTESAAYFSEESTLSVSIVGNFKRLIYIYLALYVRGFVNKKEYDFFLLLYIIGSCIYLVFNGSVLQILAGRGASYFAVYECVVFAYVITYFPVNYFEKQSLWFILFAIYFFLMWRDMNNYVILTGEDIYNPYKCVLFYTPT